MFGNILINTGASPPDDNVKYESVINFPFIGTKVISKLSTGWFFEIILECLNFQSNLSASWFSTYFLCCKLKCKSIMTVQYYLLTRQC